MEGRRHPGVEVQAAGALVAAHQVSQAGLVDGEDPVLELADAFRIDVHAEDVVTELGEARPCDQPDITHPEGHEKHGFT